MNAEQARAVVTTALMAAFSDGLKDDRERSRIKALAARISEPGLDIDAIYEEVLLRKPDLSLVASPLAADRSVAQFVYEIAVGVADSDGVHTPAEGAFLEQLASTLKLPANVAKQVVETADSIAASSAVPLSTEGSAAVRPDVAQIDKRILDASITNAALELLPESLASMAILPLQVRMVYRLGQAYGFDLDSGHIKEFIATLGIGMTGQYLEQFVRKLAGGVLGGIGRQAASAGMAFATTWAIGQLANQYYAGGRTLDATRLRSAFTPLVEQGQSMIARYGPAIEERARSINLRNLPQLIRQG